MKQSETIGKLADALSKAQADMGGAKKTSVNPHFGKSYADLSSVWDACREPLTKNGLSVVQSASSDANGVTVTTTLLHVSGEWLSGELFLPVAQKTAQGYGGAITYGRRYALAAMVGVAQEDDDANEASKAHAPTKEAPKATQKEKKTLDVDPIYRKITQCKTEADLALVSVEISGKKQDISPEDLSRLGVAYLDMKKLLAEVVS